MNRNDTKKQDVNIVSQAKASKLKMGIVVAEFNKDITQKLLDGAVTTFLENGLKESNIEVLWVPGGFEIPLACQKMAKSRKKYDALIAMGSVIRGDTDHYVYIANEASRGVMDVMLKYDLLIANCILTVNNLKQAQDRCGKDNKGSEAAIAALKMVV